MEVRDLFEVGDDGEGNPVVVLRVHVQPGAGRSAVAGRHGTALKVRVAAPPVGGRANDACAELLAGTFGVRTGQVELVGGPTSRAKQFRVSGVDVAEFARMLEQATAGGGPVGRPNSAKTGRR